MGLRAQKQPVTRRTACTDVLTKKNEEDGRGRGRRGGRRTVCRGVHLRGTACPQRPHLEKNATQMPAISWRLTAHLPAPASPDNQPPKEPPQHLPEFKNVWVGCAQGQRCRARRRRAAPRRRACGEGCHRYATAAPLHTTIEIMNVSIQIATISMEIDENSLETVEGSHRAWFRWSHRRYPRRSNTPRRWRGRAGSTLGPRGKTSRRAL